MKALGGPAAPDPGVLVEAVVGLVTQDQLTTPKRKQGSAGVASCHLDCTHSAALPSDILIEMKVAVCVTENSCCKYMLGKFSFTV